MGDFENGELGIFINGTHPANEEIKRNARFRFRTKRLADPNIKRSLFQSGDRVVMDIVATRGLYYLIFQIHFIIYVLTRSRNRRGDNFKVWSRLLEIARNMASQSSKA